MTHQITVTQNPGQIALSKKSALHFCRTKVQRLNESYTRFFNTVFRLISKAALGRQLGLTRHLFDRIRNDIEC